MEDEDGFAPVGLAQARVAIVGLGLMGGSLAAALMTAAGEGAPVCREVVGVARDAATLALAQNLRFIHRGSTDMAAGVQGADVVILATPARDIIVKLGEIGPLLEPGCVVMDLGSTKRAICAAMEALPPHAQPVGGHPMCGKESSGLTVAEPGLFRERAFVLCPLARTAPWALGLARQLAEAVGARPVLLDPARHDRLAAAISHLPYMMSAALVNAAEQLADGDALAWQLAAGGFRDTSRVAAGSAPMMLDILLTNRGPALEALRLAQAQLAALADALERADADALRTLMERARDTRRAVFP